MRRGLVIALTCLAAFAPAAHASHSALLAGGDVVILAHFSLADPAHPNDPEVMGLTRLAPDGDRPRPDFGRNGYVLQPYDRAAEAGVHRALVVDSAGRILVATDEDGLGVLAFTADGARDGGAAVPLDEDFVLRDMVATSDGVLIAGSLGDRLAVLKLTTALALDDTFGEEGIYADPQFHCGDTCHVRTSGGSILAGGTDAVVKLLADGSPDRLRRRGIAAPRRRRIRRRRRDRRRLRRLRRLRGPGRAPVLGDR